MEADGRLMSSISRSVHVIPIGVFKISAPQVLTHHMIYMAEIVGVLVGSLMVLFLMLYIEFLKKSRGRDSLKSTNRRDSRSQLSA